MTPENEKVRTAYTMHELWDLACGAPDMSGGRPILLHYKEAKIRYAPTSVMRTAVNLLNQYDKSPDAVADYLVNAFYLFRACVIGQDSILGTPHIFVDGAYEWPRPAEFGWEDVDKVVAMGRYIHGQFSGVQVISPEEGIVTEISVGDEGVWEKETRGITERERSVDSMGKTVNFYVPSLQGVGFVVDSMQWQNTILADFSNPLSGFIEDWRSGTLPHPQGTLNLFRHHLVQGDLRQTFLMKVGVYLNFSH